MLYNDKWILFLFTLKIDFIDDNKFTLEFSHEEHIQEIIFLQKKNYYIVILNCNLVVKRHIEHKKTC